MTKDMEGTIVNKKKIENREKKILEDMCLSC